MPFRRSDENGSTSSVPDTESAPTSCPVPVTFSTASAATDTDEAAGSVGPTTPVSSDCASVRTCAASNAEFHTRTSSMSHWQ